jgi:ubiquinone/menaquinone biosynthesis C-methylase UbiE
MQEVHTMNQELVRNYYAAFGEKEWDRLTWPEGAIEFAITTHALNRHLPERGRVLDIGGGPGRYSIWLAQHGYQVVLADLSPNLLDIARAKISEAGVQSYIEDVVTCDVCNLARFEDASFDALLCLGPFYHLVQPADRTRAVRELVRVLKPGGIAFVAFMPIYTFLRRTLALKDERRHLADPEFISRLMDEGVFLNDVAGRFNTGFGIRPKDIAPFMEQYGLKTLEVLADTGFAASLGRELQELAGSDPQAYQKAMALIIDTASDPSLLGASVHLLYVGLKVGQIGLPSTLGDTPSREIDKT